MSDQRLERFVAAYNKVFEKAKRNGADDAQAQDTAIRIAFGIAKNASFAGTRKVEGTLHYFAAMAPEMGSSQNLGMELSFDVVTKDLEFAKIIASGNTFNVDHDRGEGAGIVRDVILPSEAPPEVASQVDPDAPFLFVASYFEDTPADLREIEKVSAEWVTVPSAAGKKEALPFSFCVSQVPVNGPELGIRRIASHGMRVGNPQTGNPYNTTTSHEDHGESLMGDEPAKTIETLEAQVAAEVKKHETLESEVASLREKLESAETAAKRLETIETALASLTGTDEADEVTPEKAVTMYASQAKTIDALEKQVAALNETKLDKEARDFVTGLVESKVIKPDRLEAMVASYKEAPEHTRALFENVQIETASNEPKSVFLSVDLAAEQEKEMNDWLKGAFTGGS